MSKRKANAEEYPKFDVELDDSHVSHIKKFVRLTVSKKIARLLETDKSLTSLDLEGIFLVHFR